jgi:Kef-type K+ transport system membrane component KefB
MRYKGLFFSNFPWFLFSILFLFTPLAVASGSGEYTNYLLWIAIFLLLGKTTSFLVEKVKQPPVLGELLVGVILGNLALLGIQSFEILKYDTIIAFLAELGVVILLFQIGLESNVEEMKRVGWRAFGVAVVGVVAPFVLGTFVVGPWIIPNHSFEAYLFLGATLTATSVGITGRVFKDLDRLKTPEAQIILGAAVIDDVMGLIILAVISAIVTAGSVSIETISLITLKAFLFLTGAIFLGHKLSEKLGNLLSHFTTGIGVKLTIALGFCLIFSYLADLVGLAPIVGAFAAGLVLENVNFKGFFDATLEKQLFHAIDELEPSNKEQIKIQIHNRLDKLSHRHLENLIMPLGHFLVPMFFISVGMQVNLKTLFDLNVLSIALIVTVVAFIGKLISGLLAGPVNKYIVGWGMAPRGEVGLIFAMQGKQLGVVSETMFSVVIIMVVLTTLFTPLILNYLLRKQP